MKQRHNLPGQSLKLAAAAVVMALGSGTALAQQGVNQEPAGQQSAQQQPGQAGQQPGQAGQQPGQQPGQAGQADREERTDVAAAEGAGRGSSVDLDQLAEEHQDLSKFFEAVEAAGMQDSLTDGTSYTVFAPTDDAFEEMTGIDIDELLQPQNRDQLISMLRAHIVADDVDTEMARSLRQAQTIDGGTINISESDGELMAGDANVVQPDIQQGSLRIHAIDGVLSEGLTRSAAAEGFGQGQGQSEAQGQQDQSQDRDRGLESDRDSDQDSDSLLR
jgi:uncharacterized surface protein with fasciclin (FAS1) repeats